MTALLIDEVVRDKSYMSEAIEFAKNYLDGKFVLFEPYQAFPKLQQYGSKAILAKKLLSLRLLRMCDRNATVPTPSNQYDVFQFSDQYIGEIAYLQNNGETVIIFCDPARFKLDVKEIGNTYFVNHYEEECNSKISDWISNGRFDIVQKSKIYVPTVDNPLPNKKLCSKYKKVLDEISCGKADKKSDYITVASEVARRNMYHRDLPVEAKNKRKDKMRRIFSCHYNGTQYVSIDMEKGALEAHDRKGKHLGEYSYEGVQTDPPDKSGKHDITV